MPAPRPPHVALAAWIVTGPVGHLWAGVADWTVLLAALARTRAGAARAGARAARPVSSWRSGGTRCRRARPRR